MQQRGNSFIYLLSLSGDELLTLAGISRVSRNDGGRLIGYQREGVKKHVKEISEYLQDPAMILAHPLILSFSSNVKFVSSRGQKTSDGLAVAGLLRIPVPNSDKDKPAWIVDGQQRALAIEMCEDKRFAVPVCAFIADDVELQRDQFMRINNSKPLPRGLVTELLPEVDSPLPPKLAIRKVPSALCDLLNTEKDSPFRGLIRRPSTPKDEAEKAVVTDTVIVKMIEDSLTNPSGCLFPYRNVKETFPDAWGKPPHHSRLMHGIGLRSMGKLMDRIMGSVDLREKGAPKFVKKELEMIADLCRWTDGEWDALGGLAWNELQNVHKHHSMVSNFLIRSYMERRGQS
ncbi:DGQHR domain-containing protein [bacterium]|nr:DGQHR domain-containing protein [bacterium]